MTPIETLRHIQAQRDASRNYAIRARWLSREAQCLARDGAESAGEYFVLSMIAERASLAEMNHPDDPDAAWCACSECWRYLTRVEDWHG